MSGLKEDIYEHASAIYETIADELKSWFGLFKEIWPLALLLILAFCILVWLAKPAPPTKVLMATGTGGSYKALGEEYQAYFEKKGIKIELIPTQGSIENLEHLIDRKDPIQAALVQGGMIASDHLTGVESLGSIDYEPVWIFYRKKLFNEKQKILDRDIVKLKIAIGPIGSGTHIHALKMMEMNNLPILFFLSPVICLLVMTLS